MKVAVTRGMLIAGKGDREKAAREPEGFKSDRETADLACFACPPRLMPCKSQEARLLVEDGLPHRASLASPGSSTRVHAHAQLTQRFALDLANPLPRQAERF